MDTKTCDTCGRDFSRPSWSSGAKWERQRFCSVICANRARAEQVRLRGSDTKPCEHCGSTITWPANLSAKQWAAKRFCNHRCAGAAQRAKTDVRRPARHCSICGADFRSRYASQRTCGSDACQAQHRRTISGPAAAERMRADYAAGRRKKVDGVSPRERALWPFVGPEGWVWRFRWFEWPDGAFELDFAHVERKLNVEIDGVEHRQPRKMPKDQARDAELERRGWRILRVPNEDVDASPEAVAARIVEWAAGAG